MGIGTRAGLTPVAVKELPEGFKLHGNALIEFENGCTVKTILGDLKSDYVTYFFWPGHNDMVVQKFFHSKDGKPDTTDPTRSRTSYLSAKPQISAADVPADSRVFAAAKELRAEIIRGLAMKYHSLPSLEKEIVGYALPCGIGDCRETFETGPGKRATVALEEHIYYSHRSVIDEQAAAESKKQSS